jgi:hypothetical protein
MPDLTPDPNQLLLRQFTCLAPNTLPDVSWAQVRQALLWAAEQSDYQILGICSDRFDQAIAALEQYRSAFNYPNKTWPQPVEGPVYIKFNPLTGSCNSDRYSGEHRGVLVSCQSSHEGEINETFGHLPLDLWVLS